MKKLINIFIYNKYLRPSFHCRSAAELENMMVIETVHKASFPFRNEYYTSWNVDVQWSSNVMEYKQQNNSVVQGLLEKCVKKQKDTEL